MDIAEQILNTLSAVSDNLENTKNGTNTVIRILEEKWSRPKTRLEAELIEMLNVRIRELNSAQQDLVHAAVMASSLKRPEIRSIE